MMRWWLGRRLPAFAATARVRQDELLECARYEAFRARPGRGAGILVAALGVGLGVVILSAWLAWLDVAPSPTLVIAGAGLGALAAGVVHGLLYARAVLDPLRRLLD
jgi:hypothetical protein